MSNDQFEAGLDRLLEDQEASGENVVSPEWERAWLIDTPKLTLAIRSEPGCAKPYTAVNVDFISGLGLENVFSKGMLHGASRRALSSLRQNIRDLKCGFCEFLNAEVEGTGTTRASWEAGRFTAHDLTDFASFLRKSKLSNSSRDGRVYAFKNMIYDFLERADGADPNYASIKYLSQTPKFKSLAKDARSTTGGIRSEARHAEKFLSFDNLIAINDGVEKDVRAITLEWWKKQELIEAGERLLDGIVTKISAIDMRNNLPLLLATASRTYPTTLPGKNVLFQEHRTLYNAIRGRSGIGLAPVRKALHATTADLVPFFILLLIRTRYNPGVLNDLRWTEISDRGDVITLAPFKNRAHRSQIRSEAAGDSKDPLSLRSILITLRSMTARLRPLAAEADQDRVFIHGGEKGPGVVANMLQCFGSPKVGVFQNFLERHQLEKFQLTSIRSTLLDAIANGDGGIIDAAREGNHSEVVTTLRHYVSIRTAEKRRITLAETTHQQQRWAETGGRIDPRHQTSTADLKAATPGFGCLNPFESPFSDEVVGRLCQSEGHCARCPNAFLRSDDPVLVAYVIAYAEAAARATHLPPSVFNELNHGYIQLLRAIPEEVITRSIDLPKPDAQIK